MEADFFELMPNIITIARWSSDDAHGNPTYATGVEVRCRLENRRIDRGSGRQGDTFSGIDRNSWIIYTDYISPPWGVKDKATFDSVTVYIQDVDIEYDEVGPHHLVLTGATDTEA